MLGLVLQQGLKLNWYPWTPHAITKQRAYCALNISHHFSFSSASDAAQRPPEVSVGINLHRIGAQMPAAPRKADAPTLEASQWPLNDVQTTQKMNKLEFKFTLSLDLFQLNSKLPLQRLSKTVSIKESKRHQDLPRNGCFNGLTLFCGTY